MAVAAVRYWAPETRGGEVKSSRGDGGGRDRLGSVRGFVGCVGGEGSCACHLSRMVSWNVSCPSGRGVIDVYRV